MTCRWPGWSAAARHAQAGRDQPRAQRRPVPRRAARVRSARCWRRCASRSKSAASPSCGARHAVEFPASFALVAAMNPCPCGYYGSALRNCICDVSSVRSLSRAHLGAAARSPRPAGRGAAGRLQVAHRRARRRAVGERARARGGGARDPATAIRRHRAARQRADGIAADRVVVPARSTPRRRTSGASCERRGISARGVHRILRVARTIADLRQNDAIEREDLQCAIDFRALDQELR